MINIKNFTFNPFQERTLVVWDDTMEGIILDPGCYDDEEFSSLTHYIESEGIKPVKIILTHGHPDHVYGVAPCIQKYNIPVYMNPADKPMLEATEFVSSFGMKTPDISFDTVDIAENDSITFGNTEFKVIETPGHTPGGVCYYCEKAHLMFTGDTLFAGTIGRTDLPGGDYDKLILSVMDKVMGYDGGTDIIPGHGGDSTIADERTHNPFLQPFNEPEQDMINWNEDGIELDGGLM